MRNSKITSKEYEAIATMRDLAVIFHQNIDNSGGDSSAYLAEIRSFLDGMTARAQKDYF